MHVFHTKIIFLVSQVGYVKCGPKSITFFLVSALLIF